MLQSRLFSYADTHRHRLGTANYQNIPVNCPYRAKVSNYYRDGVFATDNGGAEVNYEPNSRHGPKEAPQTSWARSEISGATGRFLHNHPNDDTEQPRNLFRKVMNDEQRATLINNIVGHMKGVTKEEIKITAIRVFYKCDPDWGARIAKGLGIDIAKITAKH